MIAPVQTKRDFIAVVCFDAFFSHFKMCHWGNNKILNLILKQDKNERVQMPSLHPQSNTSNVFVCVVTQHATLLKIKSKLSWRVTLHLSEVMFIVSVDIIYTGISRPDYPQLDGRVSGDVSRGCSTKILAQTSGYIKGSPETGMLTTLLLTSIWSISDRWTQKVEQIWQLLCKLFLFFFFFLLYFIDLATVYFISAWGLWIYDLLVNLLCICLTLYFICLVIVNMSHWGIIPYHVCVSWFHSVRSFSSNK